MTDHWKSNASTLFRTFSYTVYNTVLRPISYSLHYELYEIIETHTLEIF